MEYECESCGCEVAGPWKCLLCTEHDELEGDAAEVFNICQWCNGSVEGSHPGTRCHECNGLGTVNYADGPGSI